MRCLKIRRFPLLKGFLYTMWYSWLTMVVMCLASVLMLILTDYHVKPNFSEIASSFTLGCFIFTVCYFPINIFLLLMIQLSGLIPFLMSSPLSVCIESSIFYFTLVTIDRLLFPTDSLPIVVSVLLILGLSFIVMLYLKWKHNIIYVAYKRIMRGSHSCYLINKEVDIFIILMILLILLLVLLSWK